MSFALVAAFLQTESPVEAMVCQFYYMLWKYREEEVTFHQTQKTKEQKWV